MAMAFSKSAARRKGFTLIELLIVIVVIAILVLIVIPRVLSAGRKAREATLKANLHQLRNALEQFMADTGMYPTDLSDLTAARASAPTSGIDDLGAAGSIPDGSYQGPYLSISSGIPNSGGIPVNPFKTPQDADYGDISAHWSYDAGIVHPAVPSGDTLDGEPFSEL